jgi:ribosome-binding factor A
MDDKIERLNDLLHEELAVLLNKIILIEGCLITVSGVSCNPELSQAKVFISVLPEKFYGTVLKELKKNNSRISKALKKQIKIRQIPNFVWQIDATEKNAAFLEEIFKKI